MNSEHYTLRGQVDQTEKGQDLKFIWLLYINRHKEKCQFYSIEK